MPQAADRDTIGCCDRVRDYAAASADWTLLLLTLRLRDATGEPVAGARVNLEGGHVASGHGSGVRRAREVAPADTRVHSNSRWPGDWVVLIHVTLRGGRKLERQVRRYGRRTN